MLEGKIKLEKEKVAVGLSLVVLFLFNLYLNFQFKLLALIQDDFSYWQLFINRHDFFSFIFNTGANKFRPILNIVVFFLFTFFGTKIWLFGYFNLFLSFVISGALFYFFYKISKSIYISLMLGLAFLVSRFAYYDISQLFGIMEALGILFSAFIIYFLWRYLNTERIKYFWVSLAFFFAVVFVHERYISLVALFIACILMTKFKKRNLLLLGLSTLPLILNIVLKISVLKLRPLDGTGGTDITDTFKIPQFMSFIIEGIKSIFGVNNGPMHLNGLPFTSSGEIIRILTYGGIILLTITASIFILILFSKKTNRVSRVKNIVLFTVFVGCTLIAASVTFRQELRWLYVSYVGFLFLVSYIAGILKEEKKFKIAFILILLWLLTVLPTNIYFRGYYKNLYFWKTQTLGNNIYNKTIGKYGDNFWEYKTFIITDLGRLPLYTGNDLNSGTNSFFAQFAGKKYQPNVRLISKISDIPKSISSEKILFFKYDKRTNRFYQIKGN